MTTSAFGQTLHYITSIKLQELERQREACALYVNDTIEESSKGGSPIARARSLIKRIDNWKGLGSLVSVNVNLIAYKQWLHQAQHDPSISPSQVTAWADELEKELKMGVNRYDYAKLFGDLLGEWLKSGDSLAVGAEAPSDESLPEPKNRLREERFVQQEKIQELIFDAKKTDKNSIKDYLQSLFSEPDADVELNKLRTRLGTFGANFLCRPIEPCEMEGLIGSLLSRDLLSPEKAATMKSFIGNNVILQEVTSVLNMQMARIDGWDWQDEGVKVEMRRHLSGKYRAYMDNEIMEALLFQYIGMKWSVEFKAAFRDIASSRAWKVETPILSREQLKRRQEFLNEGVAPTRPSVSDDWSAPSRGRGGMVSTPSRANTRHLAGTIESKRHALQLDQFFMTQLPKTMDSEDAYDDEPSSKPNQGANAQQVLLRLVSTEAHLKKALHGSCTIMRADLEWFGLSLPHDSILAVLDFFGMSPVWLAFMKKWLNAKLRFEGTDDVRMRARGVPIAHSLSVLCGEAVLFGMDFAVNQRAGGLYVYRIYDDFWLWSHDSQLCAAAWREMTHYAKLVGITFNMNKTGAVCVGSELEPTLPKGVVAWGFLTFDAMQGRFTVDQKAVDIHIAELKRQLISVRSVFGFINAFNKYIEFFRRNFAQPAPCFGLAHVDEVVSTFARILKEVFSETGGSVVLKIQDLVEARFGVKNIPSGWCFLPVAQGGLEIVNPVVSFMTVRDTLRWSSPETGFKSQLELEKHHYASAKEKWMNGAGDGISQSFLSFEEYVLGRETRLSFWGNEWSSMQEISRSTNLPNPSRYEPGRTDAECWNVALYEREIVEKFGGLKIVEPTLIPVGMLTAFRSAKIAWDS